MDTQIETEGNRSAADRVQDYYHDGEEYVRRNPAQVALVAVGAGFLLAQLPLRYIVLAFLKLLLLLVKPATFIYAICKFIDDVRGQDARPR